MASRTIILVRHGQYIPRDEKQVEKLTPLGRRQAQLVGRRLREEKFDRIVYSSMPRAVETASIIKKQLKYKKTFISCELIRECVPGFPKAIRKKYGFTDVKKLKLDQAQAEKAFKKYFRKPKKDSVELLVCHGNMIRYLVCRALGVNTLTWQQMDIFQCGISIVKIRSRGHNQMALISHNDVGHIPKKQRTFI